MSARSAATDESAAAYQSELEPSVTPAQPPRMNPWRRTRASVGPEGRTERECQMQSRMTTVPTSSQP